MARDFTNKGFALWVATPVLLASASGSALAQAQQAAGPPPSSQTSSLGVAATSDAQTGDIIVTAQRRSTTLQRTPVAVTVLTGDTLAKQNIASERDLQITAPGLTVKAGQNSNNINFALRGQSIDFQSNSAAAVLPYFNEVPVLGGSSGAFYDLQSIQVVKGPQGTLFGRNVTGGAVLFSSIKPTEALSGYVSARYGSYDNVEIEGAISGAIVPDVLAVRAAGYFRRRDGYQLNLFDSSKLGGIERKAGRLSVTFTPTSNLTNEFVFDYLKDDGTNINNVLYTVTPASQVQPGNPLVPLNLLYPFDAELNAQKARGPYTVNVDGVNDHRVVNHAVSNITALEVGPDTTIKNVFGYTHHRTFDNADLDGTKFFLVGYGNHSTPTSGDTHVDEQFSNELQLLGKLGGGRLEYVVGVYAASSNEHRRTQNYNLGPLGNPPNVNGSVITSRSIAGYGQATFDTGFSGFKVTGGLRYTSEKVKSDHDEDDTYSATVSAANAALYASGVYTDPQKATFNKFSWTAGLQNQVSSNLLLYASSRHSFRSGGFNLATPPINGFSDMGGSQFKAEVATDFELGAKYNGSLGGVPVSANLAFYNMWVNDVQRSFYAVIGATLAGITVNVPKAEITGFEFDGNIRPARWLSVGGNLNYTNARFTQNQVVIAGVTGGPVTATYDTYPDTPKWSGLAYVDVTVPINPEFNGVLHGDVFGQTSNYFSSTGLSLNKGTQIPGYAVANFRIGIESTTGKGWSLSGLVKNAFGKTYYVGGIGFASLFSYNIAAPGEPRTFLLEARYKF